MSSRLTTLAAAPAAVMKFGSSVLADDEGYRAAAHAVVKAHGAGSPVVVVCSAKGDSTDQLVESALALNPDPAPARFGQLLATAEEASVRLMALALEGIGLTPGVLSAEELGIETAGDPLDADPVGVNETGLRTALACHGVVVVPGFVGVGTTGTTLLGRGGSDLTALFLAERLGGECRLVKDVPGLFLKDPNRYPDAGAPLPRSSWSDVTRLGRGLVQDKAVRFAEGRRIEFVIGSVARDGGTRVGGRSAEGC